MSKNFYLIADGTGKFNYSNKGFVATPHYISLVTAKYRAKDLVDGASRWFRRDQYYIDKVNSLRGITINAYYLNSENEMRLLPSAPNMDLMTFLQTHKMEREKKILETLFNAVPMTTTSESAGQTKNNTVIPRHIAIVSP